MGRALFDFQGENYIVTGASSGLGRETARGLASAGAKVLAVARRGERLEELAREFPGQVFPAVADVCDYAAMETAMGSFVQAHGKLSGSVHAAGTAAITPIKSYDRTAAHRMMETTFWAGMDLLQLASKGKFARQGSAHVLFSSADAISCERGKFAYAAAKAAVNAGVRTAAKEMASKGHRVNAVMPGWIATEMTEAPDIAALVNADAIREKTLLGEGHPADVSALVLFLLSEQSRWLTGACLPVDGGYTA